MNKWNTFVWGLGFQLGCAAFSAQAAVFTGSGTPGQRQLGLTTANTMAINPDGSGHALIVPYYSVQSGNVTVINLTNGDSRNGKAIKVRFRAAANADTVFDLTVFLAQNDVWTAVISQDAKTGLAQLSSSDSSCTLPALNRATGDSFGTNRINLKLNAADKASQTREGYIEVLTMADMPPDLSPGSLYQSIARGYGSLVNCASATVLATLNDAANEAAAAAMGFATPTTGMQGSWTVINVKQTLTYSGSATAIQAIDTYTGLPGRANYVVFPQTSAAAANIDTLTTDPLLRSAPWGSKSTVGVATPYLPATGSLPVVAAVMSDFPDFSTPYLAALTFPVFQVNELNRALAVKTLSNDYATDPTVRAATDWVFSLPTKRYSVAVDYRQTVPAAVYSSSTSKGGVEYFSDSDSTRAAAMSKVFFDREGNRRSSSVCPIGNGCDTGFALRGAVSVIGFASPNGALAGTGATGASVVTDTASPLAFANGWGLLDVSNGGAGLPVLGTGFIRLINPNVSAGVSGNYGLASSHSATK
jgi:hypothetical protein